MFGKTTQAVAFATRSGTAIFVSAPWAFHRPARPLTKSIAKLCASSTFIDSYPLDSNNTSQKGQQEFLARR
jgi:nucleoside 2-deoxyribosyltransferase